jgi:ribosomal protein S27E
METNQFDIYDVRAAECTLSPIKCLACGSSEVTYHQYIGDAYCAACGTWQLEEGTA